MGLFGIVELLANAAWLGMGQTAISGQGARTENWQAPSTIGTCSSSRRCRSRSAKRWRSSTIASSTWTSLVFIMYFSCSSVRIVASRFEI